MIFWLRILEWLDSNDSAGSFALSRSSPDIKVPLPYPSTADVVPTIGFGTGNLTQIGGGGGLRGPHGVNHQVFWGT